MAAMRSLILSPRSPTSPPFWTVLRRCLKPPSGTASRNGHRNRDTSRNAGPPESEEDTEQRDHVSGRVLQTPDRNEKGSGKHTHARFQTKNTRKKGEESRSTLTSSDLMHDILHADHIVFAQFRGDQLVICRATRERRIRADSAVIKSITKKRRDRQAYR